jgi:hypothetical protein
VWGRESRTWNIEELFGFERARLVLVHLLEVLVQLLQLLLRDYTWVRADGLTVEVFKLFLLALEFGSHL